MPAAEFLAPELHLSQIVVQRRGHRRRWEFSAGNAGRFENALIDGVETIDLGFNQLPDGVWNARFDLVDGSGQSPAFFTRFDQPFGYQMIDRAHHEERIALGSF